MGCIAGLMFSSYFDTAGFDACWLTIMLRSAVGKTHDLRSDLWWTIPLRILLDQFYTQKSTISTLAVKLSVSAIFTPRWTATYKIGCIAHDAQSINEVEGKSCHSNIWWGTLGPNMKVFPMKWHLFPSMRSAYAYEILFHKRGRRFAKTLKPHNWIYFHVSQSIFIL